MPTLSHAPRLAAPAVTRSRRGLRLASWQGAIVVFAAWTVYAAVFAYVGHYTRTSLGAPAIPYRELFLYKLPEAWIWALLTWPIVALARRFPVTMANAGRSLPLHLLFAVLAHMIYISAIALAHPWVRRGGPRPRWPEDLLAAGFLFDLFVYAAMVATVLALDAQSQALRLRTELLEAELRLLRMQLQPHFLFNTLHAVSELVHRDPERAERALVKLADLLRWTLQASKVKEVAVRDELSALEIYLEIQRLRHSDGIIMDVEAGEDALPLATPSLLLQPLVENALRHGIRSESAGSVRVRVHRDHDRLVLEVADDGRGLAPGFRDGTGLRATRARLAGLYGADHRFAIGTRDGGRGTSVVITLPAREPDGQPFESSNGGPT